MSVRSRDLNTRVWSPADECIILRFIPNKLDPKAIVDVYLHTYFMSLKTQIDHYSEASSGSLGLLVWSHLLVLVACLTTRSHLKMLK